MSVRDGNFRTVFLFGPDGQKEGVFECCGLCNLSKTNTINAQRSPNHKIMNWRKNKKRCHNDRNDPIAREEDERTCELLW